MRLLLDTHVWLWLAGEPERIPVATRALIADGETELLVSLATCWEISIKYAVHRLHLDRPPREYIPARLATDRANLLPIVLDDTMAVADLPLVHSDPFDRLLVVQAIAHDLPIVTNDREISRYPGLRLQWS